MANTTHRLLTTAVVTDSGTNLTWCRGRLIRITPNAQALYAALRSIDSENRVLIKIGDSIGIEIDSNLLSEKRFVGVYKGKPVVYYVNKNSYWLYPFPENSIKLGDYLAILSKGWQTITIEV